MKKLDLSSTDMTSLEKWLPLNEIPKKYPNFTLSQLRWMIRSKDTNQLNQVVKKIGKRLYFHTEAFSVWISQQ